MGSSFWDPRIPRGYGEPYQRWGHRIHRKRRSPIPARPHFSRAHPQDYGRRQANSLKLPVTAARAVDREFLYIFFLPCPPQQQQQQQQQQQTTNKKTTNNIIFIRILIVGYGHLPSAMSASPSPACSLLLPVLLREVVEVAAQAGQCAP